MRIRGAVVRARRNVLGSIGGGGRMSEGESNFYSICGLLISGVVGFLFIMDMQDRTFKQHEAALGRMLASSRNQSLRSKLGSLGGIETGTYYGGRDFMVETPRDTGDLRDGLSKVLQSDPALVRIYSQYFQLKIGKDEMTVVGVKPNLD